MPSEITHEEHGRGVIITLTGVVSGDDIRQANRHIYAEERLGKLRYQIWDLTEAEDVDLSSDDLRSFAVQDMAATQTNPDQIGAIVGNPEVLQGLDRIYHVYGDVWAGLRSQTFPTMAAAREWVTSTMAENTE